MNPQHDDGEWLLPLAGKAKGQPLLVYSILTVKNTLSGTHKWYEGGMKFLSSGAVLSLFCGCGTVGNGFLGEVGLDVARCVGINDTIIKKRLPSQTPLTIQSGWSIGRPCLSFSGIRMGSIETPPQATSASFALQSRRSLWLLLTRPPFGQ